MSGPRTVSWDKDIGTKTTPTFKTRSLAKKIDNISHRRDASQSVVTAEVGGDGTGECELHHGHRSGLWGMDSARAPMWPDKTSSLIVERQAPC